MLETLKKLDLNREYSLTQIYNRLIETNQFSSDLATLITMLWSNQSFTLRCPHNQPPECFTIKRTKNYD